MLIVGFVDCLGWFVLLFCSLWIWLLSRVVVFVVYMCLLVCFLLICFFRVWLGVVCLIVWHRFLGYVVVSSFGCFVGFVGLGLIVLLC